jgi:hypothetical protein
MKFHSAYIAIVVLFLWACDPDLDIALDLDSGIQPSAVELIFPEDVSECTTGISLSESESEVVFEWAPAIVGDRYILTLINLETSAVQTFETQDVTLPVILQKSTPYRWLITTTLTGSRKSTDSEEFVFFNAGPGSASYIPFPARNIAPGNGQVFPSGQAQVSLIWESADLDDDIREYDVYFGNQNPPPLLQEGISESSLPALAVSSGTYYWQIITRDRAGNESISEVFEFTVE